MKVLFALLLFASCAHAQRAQVVVLDSNLPPAWVQSLVWEAQALHGLTFAPVRYRQDPLQGQFMEWPRIVRRLSGLRLSRLHKGLRRRGPVLYLHGKTQEGFIAGIASLGGDISLGFVGLRRANGDDASAHAVTVIAHELGHNRCARHVETQTIMNTNALGFAAQPRTWDFQSLQEMARCQILRATKAIKACR